MSFSPLSLVDCAILSVVFLWFRLVQRRKVTQFPPGPKGYPLIGNVFDMMASEIWEAAREWGRTYGDLIYLTSFGQSVLVINSYETACELLEKRSIIYSDRPYSVMINELQRWDWGFALKNYGDDWRRLRAPLQKFFEPTNLFQFDNILAREAEKLLRLLLRSPREYELNIRTAVASSIMMLTYGHEVTSSEDPFVNLTKDGVREISLAMRQGTYLVDVLPLLKYVPRWFPGAGFQIAAEKGAKLSHDVRRLPFVDARDKVFSGMTATPSLTTQEIEYCQGLDGRLTASDEYRISSMCGIGYLAGADTSTSALLSFVLAMTLFPEVQSRAQNEIDKVVGSSRLPELSDRIHLPYFNAMCKELQRWSPVVPVGVAHSTRRDDTYNGYFIPAKSSIIPNQWAMLRDPAEYPDPDDFRPERFIPTEGVHLQRDPAKIAFGFGRRICPGRFLAENTKFIMAVQILAVFDISKTMDNNGRIIEPNVAFTLDGIVRYPCQFECAIKPRSKEAAELIPLD